MHCGKHISRDHSNDGKYPRTEGFVYTINREGAERSESKNASEVWNGFLPGRQGSVSQLWNREKVFKQLEGKARQAAKGRSTARMGVSLKRADCSHFLVASIHRAKFGIPRCAWGIRERRS